MPNENGNYTVAEIDQYCELVRVLDCPACGSSDAKLNGTLTSEVMSFIVITHYTKKIKVACPACLDKANTGALVKTAILGWWGIPWGIVRTIQAISQNVKSKHVHREEGPNNFLRSFVLSKVGQFEAYKGDREKLRALISQAS